MTHIDVFDPPMCCSSGVCGPSVDPRLAAFAADVDWLTAQGASVVRHNQSLTPLKVTDPVLRARRDHEAVHLRELAAHGKRTVLEPWHADILAADPVGA